MKDAHPPNPQHLYLVLWSEGCPIDGQQPYLCYKMVEDLIDSLVRITIDNNGRELLRCIGGYQLMHIVVRLNSLNRCCIVDVFPI